MADRTTVDRWLEHGHKVVSVVLVAAVSWAITSASEEKARRVQIEAEFKAVRVEIAHVNKGVDEILRIINRAHPRKVGP